MLGRFLTSLDCQERASDCRSLAGQSPTPQLALLLRRLAEGWEAAAIQIELCCAPAPRQIHY
jgi:hypothetical protein